MSEDERASGGEPLRVLVVDDDPQTRLIVRHHLAAHRIETTEAESGEAALAILRAQSVDLMLLDVRLPKMSGLQVLTEVRANPEIVELPVIMLTVSGDAEDVVRGLELGADDYVVKPFHPDVLVARVRATARRAGPIARVLVFDELRIDLARHQVLVNEAPVALTPTERAILTALAKSAGRPLSRDTILEHLASGDVTSGPRSVDFQIFSLRKKLGRAGARIETVRGLGYRLRAP